MLNNKGQTIIEVLVALSAAMVILSAITVIVLTTLNQSVASRDRASAAQYAQEALELVKGETLERTTYRFGSEDERPVVVGSNNCSEANINNKFRRCIIVEGNATCGAGLSKVTVEVSWTDSQCKGQPFCHTVPLVSCL